MASFSRHVVTASTFPETDRLLANRAILEALQAGVPMRDSPALGTLVRPSDTTEPFQRWFRYREGYTTELCRPFVDGADGLVVDPFCGFGSTLIAARNAGVESLGMDVSPLAVFVSRVKTRRYDRPAKHAITVAMKRIESLTSRSNRAIPPTIKILPKLFHPDILDALMVFRHAIDALEHAASRNFALLAWIAILEGVSNVYREGNGLKYRNRIRRGNDYSTVPYEHWQAGRFPVDKFAYVREKLLVQLQIMFEDVEANPRKLQPRIKNADAKTSSLHVGRGSASLALFSPPYCNCFNYIKAYKLELWMAGFIRTYPDIRTLTARGLRSRLESLNNPITDSYPAVVEQLATVMATGELWSPHLPDVIRGYFADMQLALRDIKKILRRGGRCVIVVGNSAYGGTLIPSDLILAHIGEQAGFKIEDIAVARHLTTSSQQKRTLAPIKEYLRESVVVLRRR